jgi:hypothetical protein
MNHESTGIVNLIFRRISEKAGGTVYGNRKSFTDIEVKICLNHLKELSEEKADSSQNSLKKMDRDWGNTKKPIG